MGNLCSSKPGLTLADVTLSDPSSGTSKSSVFQGAHQDDPVNTVACGCHDGEWVTCGEDGIVSLANWQKGSVVHTWRGHRKGVNRVAAMRDGAVSAGRDCTVKLWKRANQASSKRNHARRRAG